MNKTHYERRSHEQGNYEITPKYKDQVVVTIKSLATGQTMKVYLDEPTLSVEDGINYTKYTGHFNEKEFMVTPSEGFEVTGLPLMYPYFGGLPSVDVIRVIDAENHYYSKKSTKFIEPVNLVLSLIHIPLIDSLDPNNTSRNAVEYLFTPFGGTSEEPDVPGVVPADPVNPVNPGIGGGEVHVPVT